MAYLLSDCTKNYWNWTTVLKLLLSLGQPKLEIHVKQVRAPEIILFSSLFSHEGH